MIGGKLAFGMYQSASSSGNPVENVVANPVGNLAGNPVGNSLRNLV